MGDNLLQDMPWAQLRYGNNELKLRAKSVHDVGVQGGDAIGIRFQVPIENLPYSGWLAALFADILSGSSASGPTERVQLKLGFIMDPGPTLVLYATRIGGSNDSEEIKIFSFSLDRAEFGVPVVAPGLSGIPSLTQSGRFFADYQTTHLCFQAQADPASRGNLVVYDTKGTDDESKWVAIGYHKMIKL